MVLFFGLFFACSQLRKPYISQNTFTVSLNMHVHILTEYQFCWRPLELHPLVMEGGRATQESMIKEDLQARS